MFFFVLREHTTKQMNRCENPQCVNVAATASAAASRDLLVAAVSHCEDCHIFLCASCLDQCTRVAVVCDDGGECSREFFVPVCANCAPKRVAAAKRAKIAALTSEINDTQNELYSLEERMNRLEEKRCDLQRQHSECETILAKQKAALAREK